MPQTPAFRLTARRLSDGKLFYASCPTDRGYRGWWFIGVEDGEVWAFTEHTPEAPLFECVPATPPAAPAPSVRLEKSQRLRIVLWHELEPS